MIERLELTLPSPVENLALDEALLDAAEADESGNREFVRLWESPQPIVVVGRSTRVHLEVDVHRCQQRAIPILRRSSGGAAIVAGPGCLMYAVVLSYQLRPELKDIGRAHKFVLGRLATALQQAVAMLGSICQAGTSDLVFASAADPLKQRKFSGNSLRAKRTHLLYHGTLLYNGDLPLIEECLRFPPRVPEYRDGRSHQDFVVNLPLSRQSLVEATHRAWPAIDSAAEWPRKRVEKLVEERFGCESWNFEFR